ncbi:MAG: hypothetical protein ACRDJC_05935 [Thermomicrobiales bacterium]
MAAIPASLPPTWRKTLAGDAWRANPPLAALVLGMLAFLVISLIGLAADPRIITGAPAWMKPLKFAVSIAIYGATLLWLLTFIPDRPRLVKALSWGLLLGFALEMVLIAMQAARGTTSHFNRETPFDSAVWNAMGATIVGMWLLNAIVAFLLARRRFAAAPIVWGVRLGLTVALIGMALAFLMPPPTPEQMALIEATGSSPVIGAHAVGVADGGPGLPVVGWSTTGGDLRVGHFVGLHALQGVPLFALALLRFGPDWLSMRERSRFVAIAAAAWFGLVALVTWQALRGQPLVAPDELTLAALGGWVALTVVAAFAVIAWARTRPERAETLRR